MKLKAILVASALCVAGGANAQDSGLSVSVGVKAWKSLWTTWANDESAVDNFDVITQIPSDERVLTIPFVSVRLKDFYASVSVVPDTTYTYTLSGNRLNQKRKELDATVGYYVVPGLLVGIGYKKFTQTAGTFTYELDGPALIVAGTASLGAGVSMYGNFSFGSMKATEASSVQVNGNYRLTEVGLAYSIPMSGAIKAISLTGGYRIQVVNALDLPITDSNGVLSYRQDGRDLTQGFTLGLIATF